MIELARAIERLVDTALGIDLMEMVIQIIATILLILVVKFFFWEKVTAFIESRREIMDQELTEATEKHEEAKTLKKEAEETFEKVKLEAKQLLEDAKSRGEDSRREIIAKAKDEATNIRKSAQKDLDQEIELAKGHIRNEIIEVASMLAEKVIAKEIDEATYERLIDESIKAVQKQ